MGDQPPPSGSNIPSESTGHSFGSNLRVPILNPKNFEMWKFRFQQYVQLMDYSVWECIEEGPPTPIESDENGKHKKRGPARTENEKKERVLEMKALSVLQLAIPNEYQHQFKKFLFANYLWLALEKRFAGSTGIKRNQKDILTQAYENFKATKNETLSQTFDRFNKLVGELGSAGVEMDQDSLNRKFLRSLEEEWTVYTVSLKQSESLMKIELDNLYNQLRVFENEVEAKKRPLSHTHNSALLSSYYTEPLCTPPPQTNNFNDSSSTGFCINTGLNEEGSTESVME